jgi:hypothetical protein
MRHDNRAAHPARQRSPSGVALAQQRRRGRAARDVAHGVGRSLALG